MKRMFQTPAFLKSRKGRHTDVFDYGEKKRERVRLMPGNQSAMPEGYVSASCRKDVHSACTVLKCCCPCGHEVDK